MRHLDLFSGIGGFALAASWAGIETIQFVENNKYCKKVLNKNFPGVPIHDDIKTFKGQPNSADIISGGFPCQSFSVAGKRRGKKDDRYLWPEMFKIIQNVRPTWVLGENVAGIINMELDSVLSDLESEGYETQTFIIPAVAVDAPHRRDRVWILASNPKHDRSTKQTCEYERSKKSDRSCSNKLDAGENVAHTQSAGEMPTEQPKQRNGFEQSSKNVSDSQRIYDDRGGHGAGSICRERSEASKIQGCENVCDTTVPGFPDRSNEPMGDQEAIAQFERSSRWLPEPDVGRVAHGISTELDEAIRRCTNYENSNNQEAISALDKFRRSLLREMWESEQLATASYGYGFEFDFDFMSELPHDRAYEARYLGTWIETDETLCSMWEMFYTQPLEKTQDLQQRMLERIRTLECTKKVGKNRTDRLKGLGNAIVPAVAFQIFKSIVEVEAK